MKKVIFIFCLLTSSLAFSQIRHVAIKDYDIEGISVANEIQDTANMDGYYKIINNDDMAFYTLDKRLVDCVAEDISGNLLLLYFVGFVGGCFVGFLIGRK
jgi:hypothetical protein